MANSPQQLEKLMKTPKTLIALFLLQFFIISTPSNLALADSEFVESGFLKDYSLVSPDPERPGVRLYISPGASLDGYDKVFLTDVVLFLHPESEYQGISLRKLTSVSEEFQSYVINNLKTRRELVSEIIPGDKTLALRLAISNVYAKKPSRRLVAYTPIGMAGTGAKKAAGRDYVLSTAAFEAEILDGETGEVLAALVATQLGETLSKAKTGERSWSDIQAYLRSYATTLVDRFGPSE